MRPLVLLLRLRYRLLWAQVRLRNGKLALFFLGYLLVCLVAAVLALGAFGTALASIRLGKSEMVARAALGATYLLAIVASVVLGFGADAVFTDSFLRRYPLSDVVSLVGRHFVAVLEPLWILVAAFNLGLAAGFHILGGASLWGAVPAALLLTLTNYLLARVVSSLIRHIMATRTGPPILILLVMLLFAAPAALTPVVAHHSGVLTAVLAVLQFTPPFAAAAIVAGAPALRASAWMLHLVACCGALTAVLVWVDRWPSPGKTAAGAQASWNSSCDRIASYFGPTLGPLMGKVLRYYARSPQLRFNYPAAALSLAFFGWSHRAHPADSFLMAVGVVSAVGGISMGALPLNIFGFDGNGFRRYFLLPVSAAAVLGATALVPLLLGAAVVPISLALWLATTPMRLDLRMTVMLFSSGFGGVFLFQALGLWVSLFSPRRIDFYATFGNKLSFAANATIAAAVLAFCGLSGALPALSLRAVMSHWWIAPLGLLVTSAFYLVTLRAGAGILEARREGMISTIERGY
jgi:hypothetical protein